MKRSKRGGDGFALRKPAGLASASAWRALEPLEPRLLLSVAVDGPILASSLLYAPSQELDHVSAAIDEGQEIVFLGAGPSPAELRLLTVLNANAADSTNADQLTYDGSLGLDLTGKGVTVGVWDGGAVRASHQEFGNRVTVVDSASNNTHATHVAGTIGAAGLDADARGMAQQINIRSRNFADDKDEMLADVSLIDLSNHSYSNLVGWTTDIDWDIGAVDTWFGDRSLYSSEDPGFGKYNSDAQLLDQVLYDNPNLLSVWAAGNDNGDTFLNLNGDNSYVAFFSMPPTGGTSVDVGWYLVANSGSTSAPSADGNGGTNFDLLPADQSAKNNLVVGAVEDVTDDPYDSSTVSITSFSSTGPTDDGRIKPDIVANGDSLRSASNGGNESYLNLTGTSMAAPSVTGSAALLVEHYRNLFSSSPLSATTKGLVIHTAGDVGNTGPDYSHGWGLLDAAAAANFLSDTFNSIATDLLFENTYSGSDITFDVYADGVNPLKATVTWTDPQASTLPADGIDVSTAVLVNDLDLWITGHDSTTYYPWTLDGANPTDTAVRTTANHVDNIEQVLIDAPTVGAYTVHIGRTGSTFTQNYSLQVSGGEQRDGLGRISGVKYEDLDGDGVRDAGEPTLSGWTIYIDENDDGNLDTAEPAAVTDSTGTYAFAGLGSGTYVIREVVETGWQQTLPVGGSHSVALATGQVTDGFDFGNNRTTTVVVVDNLDSGFSTTGTWSESGATDEYNNSSLWTGELGATATFTPVLAESGTYEVYAWWSAVASDGSFLDRDSTAQFAINHISGPTHITINQDQNSGTWGYLDTVNFDAGGSENVTLTCGSDESASIADAVRFVKVADITEVIIDNLDSGFSTTGAWSESGAVDEYNSSSLWADELGATATFTPVLPESGTYEVYAWWSAANPSGGYYNREASAKYTITHYGGSTVATLDQDIKSGRWVLLDTVVFSAGGTENVMLTRDNEDNGSTIIDAVRFVQVSTSAISEIIVDNQSTTGFATTGAWSESGATDEYNSSSLWTGELGATATFTPVLAESGTYEVYAWWSAANPSGGHYNRDDAAQYTINHNGGSTVVTKDQDLTPGQWVLLDTVEFDAGGTESVTLTRNSGEAATIADAVRFVKVSSSGDAVNIIQAINQTKRQRLLALYWQLMRADSQGPIMQIDNLLDIASSLDIKL